LENAQGLSDSIQTTIKALTNYAALCLHLTTSYFSALKSKPPLCFLWPWTVHLFWNLWSTVRNLDRSFVPNFLTNPSITTHIPRQKMINVSSIDTSCWERASDS